MLRRQMSDLCSTSSRTHANTLSFSITHTLTHLHSHALIHSLAHSYSPAHTHPPTLSCSDTLTQSHTPKHVQKYCTNTIKNALLVLYPLFLFHSHNTLPNTYTRSLSHSHTLVLFFSLHLIQECKIFQHTTIEKHFD